MMRNILFILSLLFTLNLTGQDFIPTCDVEATDDGIIVTYRFNGGQQQDDPLHPGAKFWKISGFPLNDVAGQPAFPFHWDTFVIPDDCEVSVELIDSTYSDIPFTMAPAYPPLLMSDTIGYTPERVPNITNYSGWMPRSAVMKGDLLNYRGQGLVKVAVTPAQYRCNHTLRAFSMIQYKVSFTRNGARVRGRDYVSDSADSNISLTDHFLENTTLNYALSQNGRQNVRRRNAGTRTESEAQPDNRDYLIVYPSNYHTACTKIEEWKRKKGFRTHTLCSDSLSVSELKQHIMQLYNLPSVNLYYVLFIGNNSDIPAYANSNYSYPYHLTDYYYGCMEEEIQPGESKNVLPSVRRGRLLVSTPAEAETVVDKIIAYESNPPVNQTFYNTGIHCAFFQDEDSFCGTEDFRFVLTSEEIKANVEAQGKSIERIYYAYPNVYPQYWNRAMVGGDSIVPFELQRPQFTWNGKKESIINAINQGRFYVFYSGHGITPSGWFRPDFRSSDLQSLTNSNLQPVLFCLACKSGKYNVNGCLSECFLKKEDGGCVAVISSSENTYMYYSDAFAEGMFNAVWPLPGNYYYNTQQSTNSQTLFNLPDHELGGILDFGTFYQSLLTPPSQQSTISPTTIYTREAFHLFGDPSMMFYTQQPEQISDPEIIIKGDSIKIRTNDGKARFSFYSCAPSDYMIDSFIGENINYLSAFDSVYVCIDRPNYIPYVFKIIKDGIIQNENISDARVYTADNIKVGKKVTIYRPEGEVIINHADLKLIGNSVELHPGTTIINSNVVINPH